MRKLLACLLLSIPFSVFANENLQEVRDLIPKVKDAERKEFLELAFDKCVNLQMISCHMALYDLGNVGLIKDYDKTGEEITIFQDDKISTKIYKEIFTNVSAAKPKEFYLEIKPAFIEYGAPTSMTMVPLIQQSEANKEMAYKIIENQFRFRNLPVNVRISLSKKRGEYLRLLSYGYAIRGNTPEAYKGLEMLKKYAKMNNKDIWVVQHTYESISKFATTLPPQPKKKKKDEVKDITF